MKKPRGKLFTELNEAQQAQLAEWMLDGVQYHQALGMVEKEFGVKTSTAALSGFWQEVCSPALLARRARARGLADDLAEAAEKTPGRFNAATLAAISQKAFELAVSPHADPKDVRELFSLMLDAQQEERKRGEAKLAQERFQFDAAKACLKVLPALKVIAADKGLDERGKIEQVRLRLFGEALPVKG
jgi:hypothetical protein